MPVDNSDHRKIEASDYGSASRKQIKKILLVEDLSSWDCMFRDIIAEILPTARVVSTNLGINVSLINSNTGKVRVVSYSLQDKKGKKDRQINEFHPDLHVFSLHLPQENGVKIHERLGKPANTIFWTDLPDDKDYLRSLGLKQGRDPIANKGYLDDTELKNLIAEMLDM